LLLNAKLAIFQLYHDEVSDCCFSLFVVAKSKMDLMLSSDTAWQSQYQGLMEMDETNLPECAESFITLMLTITGENYKAVSEDNIKSILLLATTKSENESRNFALKITLTHGKQHRI
jgi:hypothetical protein